MQAARFPAACLIKVIDMESKYIIADQNEGLPVYLNVDAKHIRRFLDNCDGNWHNCIHVACPSCRPPKNCHESGFLFHPDGNAAPLLLPLSAAEPLFSCRLEPDECLLSIKMSKFLSMYRNYIQAQPWPEGTFPCPCMAMLKSQEAVNYNW